MEVMPGVTWLVMAMIVTACWGDAGQQVLVLSSDKMPTIQPLHAAQASPAHRQLIGIGEAGGGEGLQSVNANQRTQPELPSQPAAPGATNQSIQPNLLALQHLQTLQRLQTAQAINNFQALQGAVDRAKRSGSGNVLQLLGGASGGSSGGAAAGAGSEGYSYGPANVGGLSGGPTGLTGGKGFLGSILSISSSNSAPQGFSVDGKGPTYGNYIGAGAGLPEVPTGQRSFDLQSFKRSLLNVLLTGVRAITGGIIALKGQLVRVKGNLLSAKGNIISASGEALSQFGRNIATNALSPKPPEPPALPRPIYGPPGYMMIAIPRPVYGPPMYSPGAPISLAHMAGTLPIPRPAYGAPGFGPSRPSYQQPRFQPVGHVGLPPPPLPPFAPPRPQLRPALGPAGFPRLQQPQHKQQPRQLRPAPVGLPHPQSQPHGQSFPNSPVSFSSNPTVPGGAPPSTGSSFSESQAPSPSDGASFPSGGDSSISTGPNSVEGYGSSPPESASGTQDFNDIGYSEVEQASFDATSTQPDSYYKRNSNQALQAAHAGLLLIKPAKNVPQNTLIAQTAQDSGKQAEKLQGTYNDKPHPQTTDESLPSLNFGTRIDHADTLSKINQNERTLSLLFGSKKPTPLRPHPFTRALPPQVVAAASAQLAAQLDLAGRAPPRTAVAVSGPHGKFIMYQK